MTKGWTYDVVEFPPPRKRRLCLLVLLGLTGGSLLTGLPFSPHATAFDFFPWIDDAKVNTCFTGDSWWTTQRKDEFNSAIVRWENQISGLDLPHDPTGPCPAADKTEVDWVTHLDGLLGRVDWGVTGPLKIEFARQDGNGNSINWSFDGSPTSAQYDFRHVAIHEIGHAMGLKHPEGYGVSPRSWRDPSGVGDDHRPIMTAMSAEPGVNGLNRRVFRSDDLAGAYWARNREHQWVARPEMGEITHWASSQGNLNQCDPTYVCLPANGVMWYTVRLTTDHRQGERTSPDITVSWRRGPDATGPIRVYFLGSWDDGGTWYDNSSDTCWNPNGWSDCSFNDASLGFSAGVLDLRVRIENNTTGRVEIRRVESDEDD